GEDGLAGRGRELADPVEPLAVVAHQRQTIQVARPTEEPFDDVEVVLPIHHHSRTGVISCCPPASNDASSQFAYTDRPTSLVWRYSSMPSRAPSTPRPDCLTPPNGAAADVGLMSFTPTIPNFRRSTARNARVSDCVYTYDANPYSVSLAI